MIDVATGKIKGHFQYNPNDSWDWDEVSPPILVDYQRERTNHQRPDRRRARRLHLVPGTLQRRAHPFRRSKPFVKQNVFKSVDPKTGRADVDPDHKPGTGKMADFCPGLVGREKLDSRRLQPANPHDLFPANENVCGAGIGLPRRDVHPRQSFRGCEFQFMVTPGADHIGEVQAWNVDTGQRVWTHTYARSSNWGGMLATAGGRDFQRRHHGSQDPCL